MRRSWVYIDGIAYEKGEAPAVSSPQIMPDIPAYKSMADGSIVEGRAAHREHLRRHNCVEVGNEVKAHFGHYDRISKDVAPQQRHELIRAQVAAMTNTQFNAAVKRDIDNWKWNSRED